MIGGRIQWEIKLGKLDWVTPVNGLLYSGTSPTTMILEFTLHWDWHNVHHRISRTQAPVCPRPPARQREKLLLRCREAVPNTDAPNLLSLWTVYFRKLPKSCTQGLLRHLSDSPPGAHSHAGVQLTLSSRGSVSQSDNTHASILKSPLHTFQLRSKLAGPETMFCCEVKKLGLTWGAVNEENCCPYLWPCCCRHQRLSKLKADRKKTELKS